MIEALLLDKDKTELNMLQKLSFNLSAKLSDAEWGWHLFTSETQLRTYLDHNGGADISCLDVTLEHGVSLAERIRRENGSSFIIIVADATVSPVDYLNPKIIAGALLLRPFTPAQAQSTLKASILKLLDSYSDGNSPGFQLNLKTERKVIPYSQIYYFEARDKKVFLNVGNQEYAFYDTIDNLEAVLPSGFLRCHRSFVVAKSKIENIYISKNYMELDNGMQVPLSRSYKALLKELK
ncbi:MAG: LytTR family transcriptional regulator DNA-binding domain-containing protein [Oscillospiraceae bacterium]|nr:LytTR family transcriptional regulator DNA-binding domain-containing protein [Oscillospiraceae bacterium]